MRNEERIQLANLVLAPYIQKATALIGAERHVGGNQFRHQLATLAILIDYGQFDPVLLKTSVIHDLLEDVPEETNLEEIRELDKDGNAVVELLLEVTRRGDESKQQYLDRILRVGSPRAKILKIADRISNVTDLNTDTFPVAFVEKYLSETEEFVLPMARQISSNMERELKYLLSKKRLSLQKRQ